jgi:hypothetical protein
MHAGSIPVALDGFAIQNQIHLVFLAKTHHEIASHPGVIGGLRRSFGKDLELPLALCDLGIDAFVVDSGGETELKVLIDDLPGNVTHVFVADAAIVWSLGSAGVAVLGEAERTSILVEEVLLLKANPEVWVVLNGGAHISGVRGTVRMHDFAQNEITIFAGSVGIKGDRLQDAVGFASLCLHGGTAVKAPKRQIGERRRLLKGLELCFAAEFGDRLFAVKPDVFEFVLGHGSPFLLGTVVGIQRNARAWLIKNS